MIYARRAIFSAVRSDPRIGPRDQELKHLSTGWSEHYINLHVLVEVGTLLQLWLAYLSQCSTSRVSVIWYGISLMGLIRLELFELR